MAEQYTKVFNLFNFPGVVKNPWTTGTNPDSVPKMLMIFYVDGRVQIDGQAYLDSSLPDAVIADNQILFDLSESTELSRLLPTTDEDGIANSFVNMYAKLVGSPSMEINFSEYRAGNRHITYQETAVTAGVSQDVVWRFTGWLVPRSLTDTSALLWGK